MNGSAWETLGLERTDNVADIRRAYAARLKRIDVDADPEAFVDLRAALDDALYEAEYGPLEEWPAEAEEEAEEEEAAAPVAQLCPGCGRVHSPPVPEPAPAPAPVPLPVEGNKAEPFRRLEGLLFDDPDADIDGDALVALVEEILADPDMARVDHAARVELWLAGLAYDAIPRSDPILPLLVRHFGWEWDLRRIDQHFLFEALTQRDRAFDLLDRVADPGHDLHQAYVELYNPAGHPRPAAFFVRAKVRRLLRVVRENAPAAEAELDQDRVALWDARLEPRLTWPGRVGWFGIVWLAWLAYNLAVWIAHLR